ncbi:MAG: protein-L-isoaspartate(D-aspartate) O-methyltransferase [Proteobacteria bacterium]|nr:protein-L-isoaspartate(D-aspartate) O-methyltransferase [Pseudomonadota bacterium]MBU1060740.1 protein-L-isoaspartate(D-aspartate) O-methyltransferase [Pseudomonadota bacterium]
MGIKQQETIAKSNAGHFSPSGLRRGALFFVILFCLGHGAETLSASWWDDSSNLAKQRLQMINGQLKNRGITDPKILRAMSTVPRHLFVPDHLRQQAYRDGPLPIGHGQTISQPYIVAYMTEILQINPQHKVLEIGTGSGYQAAVLAELSDQVYTMEIIPELAASAGKRLKETGYTKVTVRQGDGYHGWPEAAPFDAIMVTAAAEFIPPPLLQQLKAGGRMIIPVGSPFYVQHLMLVEKKGGNITTHSLIPVRFVPFRRSQ